MRTEIARKKLYFASLLELEVILGEIRDINIWKNTRFLVEYVHFGFTFKIDT